MKTKHILTALALPAMFAACTADDIVSENNGLQKMPERALLSEDFVLNIDNGVESRYQVNGTTSLEFEFEANDSIGANLIDEPAWDDENDVWVEDPADWDIVDYVAPALPFVNQGGESWKSAGRLGEGNYLFTNPYNPKDGGRLAAKVEMPRVVQYSSEKPNAVIEQYNKAVAADVIYEGDMSANISLKNLYAYPKVRIHFANTEDVSKVTKVVLATVKNGVDGDGKTIKVEGDGFLYKTGLDHKYIAYMFDPRTIEAWLAVPANKEKTEDDYWAEKHTSHFVLDGLDGIDKETGEQTTYTEIADAPMYKFGKAERTPYLIYEMSESVVSYGKSKGIEVRLMLPSTDNFNTYNVIAYVCTDNGNYKFDFNGSAEGDIKFNDNTIPAKKKNALLRNTSNTLNTVPMTTTSHGTTASMDFGNVVSNVEDWNSLVAKYGDLEKYNDKVADHTPLAVSILNDEFTFTEEAEMPEVAIFTIDKAVKVEGDVTLKNVRVANTVEVKDGATLTTTPSFKATKVNVKEGGNLTFTAQVDEKTKKLVEYIGVTEVANEGTVTVPADVIAKFKLVNGETGVLNVGAAAARAAAEAKAVLNGGSNAGIINNNGVIDVVADFTNNAPNAGKNLDEEAEYGYVFIPTIQNGGIFNSKAVTTNKGLFVQAGTLSSNFNTGNSFDNDFILEVKENASTYIDDNTNARIYFEKATTNSFTIYDHSENADYDDPERGEIILKVSGKSTKLNLKDSHVNVLYVDGDLELEQTFTYTTTATPAETVVEGLHEVKFVGDGTLKIPAYTLAADGTTKVYTAKVNKVTVAEGVKVTVSGDINAIEDKGSNDENGIKIEKNAVLDIPSDAKLTIKYASISFGPAVESTDEAGNVNLGGTLVLPDQTGAAETGIISSMAGIVKAKEGLLMGAVGDSQTANDKLKAAVKEAMKPLVKAMLENDKNIGSTYDSWDDITEDKVYGAYNKNFFDSSSNHYDGGWRVNAAKSFVEVYNEIEGVTTKITTDGVMDVMKSYPDELKALIKAEKDAVSLTTAIPAIGNSWINTNVWTKTKSDQLYKNIAGGAMHTAWVAKVATLTKAEIGGAAWLSLQDKLTELTGKTDGSDITFYSSILPAKSFIPVYEASDEYKVLKAYADMLANEDVQADEAGKATEVAKNFAEVAAYLSKLYAAAAKEDAEYFFDKAVTATVTTTILDNAQSFKAYTDEQFKALLEVMEGIEGVELGAMIGKK